MGVEWYDMIARRNGGYKGRAVFTIEGLSAEYIFEQQLISMLPAFSSVLDAGCGHGDFTLKMSAHTNNIVGFDNSSEMIDIAQQLLRSKHVHNVEFVLATTKSELPFSDDQFDFIYDRRGPTSIINHHRILSEEGKIFGIHNDFHKVRERLVEHNYRNIEIIEFNNAMFYFPNELEFAKFLADTPGNPDYTADEYKEQLRQKVDEHLIDGRIGFREVKYIWSADKP